MKISSVTATRNRCELLKRCVESVNAQRYADKEHVIVDAGSTDGTLSFLKTQSDASSHLKFISEPDRGPSDAMNKGLRLATGDVLGVIGDDDFYEPGAFDVVAREFQSHPAAGIVAGNCRLIRNDGSAIRVLKAAFTTRDDLIECWRYWGNRVNLSAPSAFIRREVIDQVGLFEERDRYAMDYRHWIKIAEHYEIRTVDMVLANFRYDEGNISFSAAKQQWNETISISKEYWGSAMQPPYWRFLTSYIAHGLVRPRLRKLKRVLSASSQRS